VQEQAWLTRQEFIDAIRFRPDYSRPILISAHLSGTKLWTGRRSDSYCRHFPYPPALLMLVSAHFLNECEIMVVQAVLRGYGPAVIRMIAAAAWSIDHRCSRIGFAVIFLAALIALLRLRVDVAGIIPSAGLTGLMLY